MPVSSFRWTRHALRDLAADDDELETRLACVGDLRRRRRAEDEDARGADRAPQRQRLGHRRDAERGRARGERRTAHVGGAVPVAVRLHDRPELRAVEHPQQRRRVAADRAEIDGQLRARH